MQDPLAEPAAPLFGPEADLFLRFAVALGLGILLGLERERRKDPETGFAGVRTFALIALAGAFSGWLGAATGVEWLVPLAFAAVALLVLASYVVTAWKGEVGVTTEVSALLAFLLGLACHHGELRLASAIGVAVALVLVLKDWLHALARRLSAQDVSAALQFAIVTVIVLPLVPDRTFGPAPFDVLNPYRVWLMVVLISGIDFASWILVKVVGREHGIGLTGLLGGLVSSTATTLTMTKRSRQEPEKSRAFALGILCASLVMLVRVGVVLSVVGGALLRDVWPALAAMALANLAAVGLAFRAERRGGAAAAGRAELAAESNPFELSNAVRFALLFAVVSFVARGAEVWIGERGLYLAGALAGLTDVDAISLSMSELAQRVPDSARAAGRAVVLALVSNTLVKGAVASFAGAPALRHALLPAVLGIAAVGALVVFLL
ncbi:MAG: MgtC/SapB family protein [Planctomycetes bacterium]|nr:MgtC/SapB family protein [Planctomycetota bacterium]